MTRNPIRVEHKALVEYVARDADDGFWIDIRVDRTVTRQLGPFASEAERQAAFVDFQDMMRELGAVDLPTRPQ